MLRSVRGFASALDSKIYNADKIRLEDDFTVVGVDQEKYERYKYKYLTSKESENILTRNIILDFIKRDI